MSSLAKRPCLCLVLRSTLVIYSRPAPPMPTQQMRSMRLSTARGLLSQTVLLLKSLTQQVLVPLPPFCPINICGLLLNLQMPLVSLANVTPTTYHRYIRERLRRKGLHSSLDYPSRQAQRLSIWTLPLKMVHSSGLQQYGSRPM